MGGRHTFDSIPELYHAARPDYPSELVDELFALLPPNPRVVEMGPGTGQLTSRLLIGGAQVAAVELGENLAGFLRRRLAHEPGLNVINAPFETAELPEAQFDAVVASTAYHWVEDAAKATRPAELLKAGGVVGIVDLLQVDTDADRGYFERVHPIYDRFGQAKRKPHPVTHDTAMPPAATYLDVPTLFEPPSVSRWPWDQTYSSAQYRNLINTYSGTLGMPEPERSQMVDELVAVIDDEYGGRLTRPLVATLTAARRRSSPSSHNTG